MPDGQENVSVTVRLKSQEKEANAAVVGKTLLAINEYVAEFQEKVESNDTLLLKARPFSEGSFEIPLDLIIFTAGTLFSTDPRLAQVLETLKHFFELKKIYQGHVPSVPSITINGENVIISETAKLFLDSSSRTNKSITSAIREMEEDSSIEGFEIVKNKEDKPFIEVSKKDFQYFLIDTEDSSNSKTNTVKTTEDLTIRSLDFDGKTMWKFYRKGISISVKMEDEGYLEKVKGGTEVFGAGDILNVDLETYQLFDQAAKVYVNKSYTITKVNGHGLRQKELFEE